MGRSQHHACTLDNDGTKVLDKPLPQLESELAALFDNLQPHSTVLVVVDLPNTIGTLPIAVSRQRSCWGGYLPGLSMQKSTSDGRKPTGTTFSSSPTLQEQCHTPCGRLPKQRSTLGPKMLCGTDDDIARDYTRPVNGLRNVLTQIYPSLKRVFPGSTLTRTPVTDLLIHYKGPTTLKNRLHPSSGVVIHGNPSQPGCAGGPLFRGTSGTNRYCPLEPRPPNLLYRS